MFPFAIRQIQRHLARIGLAKIVTKRLDSHNTAALCYAILTRFKGGNCDEHIDSNLGSKANKKQHSKNAGSCEEGEIQIN